MDILSKFGENINDLILDNGLNADSFSKALNIEVSVVYRYLRKECLPDLKNIVAIADYFQCSVDFLLGLSVSNPKTAYKPAPPFSERLKFMLNKENMSRYAFKKTKKFAKQSIDDWYNGTHSPNVDNVVKMAKFFKCSVDYLLGRE